MKNTVCLTLLGILTSITLLAQAGAPVANWTVPPYQRSSASGGLTTMADISDAAIFVAVTPCRIIDTRFASGTGHGSPALVALATRTFDMNAGPCTGIPENVAALSLSIAAILPGADGFLTAWPTGTAMPAVSQLNFLAGEVVANAAIVPTDSLDNIDFFVNAGPTHIYVDVNGYFVDSGTTLNASTFFTVNGSNGSAGTITGFNGNASSTAITMSGVRGIILTTASGPSGVLGQNFGDAGANYAVRGINDSSSVDSAGVLGTSDLDDDTVLSDGFLKAGVRGVSGAGGYGVLGLGEFVAVNGTLLSAAGVSLATGRLGSSTGDDPPGAPPWAVFGLGNTGASGVKNFLDPHPTDPSKVIGYISLEGPEAGTYFRGRARFERGVARITVPDHFRMVSDPEGLSVQVTPVGSMATVAVISVSLNEIVVQSSRNVEFFYLVQGVRSTFKDKSPIFSDGVFRPESAEATIPAWLSEGQKRLLVSNGTYRPDGTVNIETARRLGWDRLWKTKTPPAPLPATGSSAQTSNE